MEPLRYFITFLITARSYYQMQVPNVLILMGGVVVGIFVIFVSVGPISDANKGL